MNKRTHTPGPWLPTTTPAGRGKVVDASGFSVCNVTTQSYKQQVIDSHLIAAAPDLYEVLSEWDWNEPGACGCDTASCRETCLPARTRAALAKARGEHA